MKTLQDHITKIKNSNLYNFKLKLKLNDLIKNYQFIDNIAFALKYLESPASIYVEYDDKSSILLERKLVGESLFGWDNSSKKRLLTKNIYDNYYLVLTVDLNELGSIEFIIFREQSCYLLNVQTVIKILNNNLEETDETYEKLDEYITSFFDVK